MKFFSATLSARKAAAAAMVAYAVEISTDPAVRLCSWDQSISLSGNSFVPLVPIDKPAIQAAGGLNAAGSIKIGNVDDTFTSLYFAGSLKSAPIKVYEVFLAPGAAPEAETLFEGRIAGADLDNEYIALALGPLAAGAEAMSPRRRLVPACGFVFKSSDCGYTGLETHCPKTKEGCLSGFYAGFRFVPPPGTEFVWGGERIKVK